MTSEHENWADWARQIAEAEIRDLRIEWRAAIVRAEQAKTALAAVPVAELRRLAQMHRAYQWSSTDGPALWAAVEAWLAAQP